MSRSHEQDLFPDDFPVPEENADITVRVNGIDGGELKSFIERIEHMDEEVANVQESRRNIYSEAKIRGFDPAILKKIIKIRKRDKADLDEEEMLTDIYMRALGMGVFSED